MRTWLSAACTLVLASVVAAQEFPLGDPGPNNIRLCDDNNVCGGDIGRLEVLVGGTWGTVCDDHFNVQGAELVCQALGHTGGLFSTAPLAFQGARFQPIHLDDIECLRTDTSFFDCPRNALLHNCGHDEDLFIECNNDHLRINTSFPIGTEESVCGRAEIYASPGTVAYSELVETDSPLVTVVPSISRKMTSDANYSVSLLAEFTVRSIPGYNLSLLGAYTSRPAGGAGSLPPTLFHAGRAVMLTVVNATTGIPNPNKIGQLAALAIAAGFDWVYWNPLGYLHASVRPDSCQTDIDMLFLIDNSGSISSYFQDELEFVESVISFFQISPNQTRAAAISYSDSSDIQFNFQQHTDARALRLAVDAIQYTGGSTNTHLALDDAIRMFTSPSYGARVSDASIPKVCLLITDGAASNTAATSTAARNLRNLGVTVFAVGAGNINRNQLEDAASDPDSDHVLLIESAANITSLVSTIAGRTCVTSALIADCLLVNDSVLGGEFKYFTPSFQAGSVILEVSTTTAGGVSVFVSGTDDSPGPFYYNMSAVATPQASAIIVVNRTALGGSGDRIYVSVMGNGYNTPSNFTIESLTDVFPGSDSVTVPVASSVPSNRVIYDLSTTIDNSDASIQFSLSASAENRFYVTQQGTVKTNGTLTFATQSSYTFQVLASSVNAPCLRGAVSVTVQGPTTRSPTTPSPATNTPTATPPTTPGPSRTPTRSPSSSIPTVSPTPWVFDPNNLRPPTITTPPLATLEEGVPVGTFVSKINATHPGLGAGNELKYSLGRDTIVNDDDVKLRRSRRADKTIPTPFSISNDGTITTNTDVSPGNMSVLVNVSISIANISNSSTVLLNVLVNPRLIIGGAATGDDGGGVSGGSIAAIVIVLLLCLVLALFLAFRMRNQDDRERDTKGIVNPRYAPGGVVDTEMYTNPMYADANPTYGEVGSDHRAGAIQNATYGVVDRDGSRDGAITNANYAPVNGSVAADGDHLYGTALNANERSGAIPNGMYGAPAGGQQEMYKDVAPHAQDEMYKDVAASPPAIQSQYEYTDVAPNPVASARAPVPAARAVNETSDEMYSVPLVHKPQQAPNDPMNMPMPTSAPPPRPDSAISKMNAPMPTRTPPPRPDSTQSAYSTASAAATVTVTSDSYQEAKAVTEPEPEPEPTANHLHAASTKMYPIKVLPRASSIAQSDVAALKPPSRPRAPTLSVETGRPLPKNWHEAKDGDGNPYFYNSETQESTWERPVARKDVETSS